MNREDIDLAIRMISGGRVNHPAVEALCDALESLLKPVVNEEKPLESPAKVRDEKRPTTRVPRS